MTLSFNYKKNILDFLGVFITNASSWQIENQEISGLSFKTHPNINKELFNSNRIIGLKDPNRPFPTGQNDVSLLKWRIQGMDESSLPLTGMFCTAIKHI